MPCPSGVLHRINLPQVTSSDRTRKYTVDISGIATSCTCPDWLNREMPCKHLFALLQYGGVTWSDLPEPFREHPLFSLDKNASVLLKANNEIGHDLALLSQ